MKRGIEIECVLKRRKWFFFAFAIDCMPNRKFDGFLLLNFRLNGLKYVYIVGQTILAS